MARIRIPLGRDFGKGRATAPGMQSLVNLYAEPVTNEGRTDLVCYGTPGKSLFATIGTGSVRGQITANGVHYAVVATRLYSITSAGATTNIGEIEGSLPVDMAFTGTDLVIVAELKSYCYTPSTLTLAEIVDGDFEQASACAALAGYALFAVKGTGRFRWAALNDATSYDALDFATAEAESDAIVALRKVGNELAILGADTTEFWYITGDADNLFARTSTAAAEIGCVARDTAIVVDSGLTWVGRDGRAGGLSVYRAEGYQPKRISTPEVDAYLESAADASALRAFAYQQGGHLFYVLTNPGEWTLAWDVATNQWSYRKSGTWTMGAEPNGGWDAVTFALNGTKQIVGASDGNLYQLSLSTLTDSGQGLVREVTTPQISRDGKRCFMGRLELDIKTGVATGSVTAPVVMACWSDDGGMTWSAPREASLGALGQYGYRAVWNACGSFRNRIIKFRVSDAVEVVIMGAWADMTVGAH